MESHKQITERLTLEVVLNLVDRNYEMIKEVKDTTDNRLFVFVFHDEDKFLEALREGRVSNNYSIIYGQHGTLNLKQVVEHYKTYKHLYDSGENIAVIIKSEHCFYTISAVGL